MYSKIDDPAYSQNELNGLVALAGSALGTKGDVLVSYEINSGSSSIGVGHTAIVSKDSSRTIESFAKVGAQLVKMESNITLIHGKAVLKFMVYG